ncbi:ISAs1 family transposase [Mesorhizobium sp. M0955]|uniref:ISAs1 family transposase n=1 Tax=Mesorhizobium sp. M0955 TaxID=2957033 RepID=UPI003339A2F3
MDDVACDAGALSETVVFLGHFKDLPDGRQSAKVRYPLDEVLLLCLVAVIAGAETITDIARFGDKKLDLLRRFRSFLGGVPSHDHLGGVLASLDAEHFQRCFVAWVASLTGAPEGVVAIDGKTVRRLIVEPIGSAGINLQCCSPTRSPRSVMPTIAPLTMSAWSTGGVAICACRSTRRLFLVKSRIGCTSPAAAMVLALSRGRSMACWQQTLP